MLTVEYKCESLNIKKSIVEHKCELLNINVDRNRFTFIESVNRKEQYVIVEYETASSGMYLNQCVEHMKVTR